MSSEWQVTMVCASTNVPPTGSCSITRQFGPVHPTMFALRPALSILRLAIVGCSGGLLTFGTGLACFKLTNYQYHYFPLYKKR